MGSKVKPKTIEAQEKNVILPIPVLPTAWRVEIDEFLADTKMTNLFLLALQKMQTDGLGTLENGKVDWWTYHNLSGVSPFFIWLCKCLTNLGIHNYPQEDWNGIIARLPLEYDNKPSKKPSKNYSRHGSVVFPTWHRAYVYQFEVIATFSGPISTTFSEICSPLSRHAELATRFAMGTVFIMFLLVLQGYPQATRNITSLHSLVLQ
jgi:hypothetical protein